MVERMRSRYRRTTRVAIGVATLLVVASGAWGKEGITDVSGWSDEQVEQFLSTAKVVGDEELGEGVTVPHRLTLEQDGQRLRAIFKYQESYISAVSGTSPMEKLNQSDSFKYDIAAYRLDRMLGLNLVPVVVEREVKGKTGAVQLWVEDAINEAERAERGIHPGDQAEFDRQWMLMEILDVLIYNIDRHAGNVLITEDGKVHAIDHTRAFRTNSGRPEHLRKVELTIPPELLEKLEALDAATLKPSMKDLLHPMQIKALLNRRTKLVKDARKAAGPG